MASRHPPVTPVVGEWYQEIESNLCFEVVAIDSASGAIDIQYLDGTIDELDNDSWDLMLLAPAEPPEDPGPAYGLSSMDEWQDDYSGNPADWGDPLNTIEADSFQGFDDL